MIVLDVFADILPKLKILFVPLSGEGALNSLRFSITGQNLFLITDYSGLDPEVTANTGDLGSGVPSRGIDYGSYPRPRTFTFGINASF